MYNNPPPNKEEFDKICEEIKFEPLNFRHIGRVFGQAFWEVLVLTLCDAKDATAILMEIKKRNDKIASPFVRN